MTYVLKGLFQVTFGKNQKSLDVILNLFHLTDFGRQSSFVQCYYHKNIQTQVTY